MSEKWSNLINLFAGFILTLVLLLLNNMRDEIRDLKDSNTVLIKQVSALQTDISWIKESRKDAANHP